MLLSWRNPIFSELALKIKLSAVNKKNWQSKQGELKALKCCSLFWRSVWKLSTSGSLGKWYGLDFIIIPIRTWLFIYVWHETSHTYLALRITFQIAWPVTGRFSPHDVSKTFCLVALYSTGQFRIKEGFSVRRHHSRWTNRVALQGPSR